MHGAGNSFVLVEDLHGELGRTDLTDLAVRLCDEKRGPGADGLIILTPAGDRADFGMRFYNADGSVGEMCGNGARCLARYGVEHGLVRDAENIRILALAGLVQGRRISREVYQIRLNDPSRIDLQAVAEGTACVYLELGDPGIPHAVVEVQPAELEEKERGRLRKRGRELRFSSVFPKGANVTFACRTGETLVKAVTYERGVEDFTLACGTGCGAVAVSFLLRGVISGSFVEIDMPGGRLSVLLTREGCTARNILLTGPTAVVETGTFFPEG